MKYLITGGAGFLGSHLAEALLRKGNQVSVIDCISEENRYKIEHLFSESKFKFYKGSVLDKNLMDRLVWDSDIIFHFAAIVGVDNYVKKPYDVLNVNILGTKLTLELAYKYNKKVIFASTSEIYGKNEKVPFSEEDDRILGPTTIKRWCYSSSKAVAEHYCFAFYEMGLPVVILRFFNAYGPRLDSIESGRIISVFIGQLLRGQPLTVVGNGQQTRCFIYVDDIIEGIIAASEIKEAEGEAINLGTDVETKIIDLAKLMIKIYGKDPGIKFIKSEGKYGLSFEDIKRRVPDISKARRLLNFESKITLEEGLRRTTSWFKDYYKSIT